MNAIEWEQSVVNMNAIEWEQSVVNMNAIEWEQSIAFMFSMLCFTPSPTRKRSVVRAQRSVVGRSRSKDLLIGRLTILVLKVMANTIQSPKQRHSWPRAFKIKISRSGESLRWLVNLISRGLNLTYRKLDLTQYLLSPQIEHQKSHKVSKF